MPRVSGLLVRAHLHLSFEHSVGRVVGADHRSHGCFDRFLRLILRSGEDDPESFFFPRSSARMQSSTASRAHAKVLPVCLAQMPILNRELSASQRSR